MGISSARAIFFQRLNGRNRVPILNTGDVAPQKPGALFDVSLGELL